MQVTSKCLRNNKQATRNWNLKVWNLKFERDSDEWYSRRMFYLSIYENTWTIYRISINWVENCALNKQTVHCQFYNWKKKILQC